MTTDTLSLERVEAGYGLSRVLHGVSLTARAGEVVSLLGRNGAGKSTTLKSIVGLVEVTAGAVRFDGREITRRPTHEISRLGVGYVPEDRRIFGDLTVEENL
ncbi:MAG TPA: ATP-binding cassette domain-containing protein, partial [Methylomirabilota bacterium]